MIVHYLTGGGMSESKSLECAAVEEGEEGLYVYSDAAKRNSDQIAYIKCENLRNVEPDD